MKRLRELKKNPEKMAEFDLNKDGVISIEEWDSAVNKVEQELLEEELKSGQIDDPADVIITRGEEEKLFIISDHGQEKLVKKLGWQAFLFVFGGAALSIGILGYLCFRLRGGF